jgi:hypothetical protein
MFAKTFEFAPKLSIFHRTNLTQVVVNWSQQKGQGIAHMYGMTPEERFTRIENLLAALTEAQVRNEAQIEANNTAIEKQNAAIEKQNAGIRDLVIVSRTLVETQMKTTAQIEAVSAELTEKQKATEDKLHALIDIVDRIIRNKQK